MDALSSQLSPRGHNFGLHAPIERSNPGSQSARGIRITSHVTPGSKLGVTALRRDVTNATKYYQKFLEFRLRTNKHNNDIFVPEVDEKSGTLEKDAHFVNYVASTHSNDTKALTKSSSGTERVLKEHLARREKLLKEGTIISKQKMNPLGGKIPQNSATLGNRTSRDSLVSNGPSLFQRGAKRLGTTGGMRINISSGPGVISSYKPGSQLKQSVSGSGNPTTKRSSFAATSPSFSSITAKTLQDMKQTNNFMSKPSLAAGMNKTSEMAMTDSPQSDCGSKRGVLRTMSSRELNEINLLNSSKRDSGHGSGLLSPTTVFTTLKKSERAKLEGGLTAVFRAETAAHHQRSAQLDRSGSKSPPKLVIAKSDTTENLYDIIADVEKEDENFLGVRTSLKRNKRSSSEGNMDFSPTARVSKTDSSYQSSKKEVKFDLTRKGRKSGKTQTVIASPALKSVGNSKAKILKCSSNAALEFHYGQSYLKKAKKHHLHQLQTQIQKNQHDQAELNRVVSDSSLRTSKKIKSPVQKVPKLKLQKRRSSSLSMSSDFFDKARAADHVGYIERWGVKICRRDKGLPWNRSERAEKLTPAEVLRGMMHQAVVKK
mmetsp:Transcript_61210/g.70138  ORF Transcript_61210/g.70138 Transcript_61210/m.70138 type:complete len:600 (-) Transcript_61210:424-2223(-)